MIESDAEIMALYRVGSKSFDRDRWYRIAENLASAMDEARDLYVATTTAEIGAAVTKIISAMRAAESACVNEMLPEVGRNPSWTATHYALLAADPRLPASQRQAYARKALRALNEIDALTRKESDDEHR
jgi:hypothetical protein